MLSANRTRRVIRKFKELSQLVVLENELVDICNDESLAEKVREVAKANLMNTREASDTILEYIDKAGEDSKIQVAITSELSEGGELIMVVNVDNIIAMIHNGKAGIAKCHADDEFDYLTGFEIAFDRLQKLYM